MKIENLCVGLIAKNYKELCGLLDIPIEAGNSKKAQLKELDRFLKYSKQGNKFIIEEIYETQKEKIDLRTDGNSSIYGDNVKRLLLLLMATSIEDDEIILPVTTLLNKLSMINKNYSLGRRNQDKLSEALNIDEKYINEFYDTTHQNLRRTLETNLNQLDRKAILRWETVRMVCKKVAVLRYNDLDEVEIDMDTNKVQYNIKEEYSVATKEQDLLILEVENEVLKELGLSDLNDVFRHGRAELFYKKVYSILRKRANIKYYFNGYKLIYNRDIVIDELEKYGEDMAHVRTELNNIVKEKLLDNAIKRKDYVENEYSNIMGELPPDIKYYKKLRLSDEYISIIQTVIDNVISLSAADIRNKLKVEQEV